MYYRFNFKDLDKVGRKHGDYFTIEQIRRVPLTPFESHEDNWDDGTWFVYEGSSTMSCTPLDCDSKEQAYKNLLLAENTSIYEARYDL
jgi:hypothetical protein